MRRACAAGLFLTVFAVASWGSGSSERDLPDGRTPPQEALPREYQDQAPPGGTGNEFETDFSRATISYAEILSGGPRKDGIPAIDAPRFVSVAEAGEWVSGNEPVLVLEERIAAGESDRRVGDGGSRTGGGGDDRDGAGGAVHVYPLQILTWHEIVNDVVGEIPVAVTYCPLCNTGIAFDRRHAGEVLDFGTTGRLRFSNLLMYDRQTESWWQQASGAGVIGRFAGTRLRMVPVMMISFAEAADIWPDARVLSRETGFSRAYGANPYIGYDSSERPFLFRGPAINGAYNPLDRVVSITIAGESAAVAFRELRETPLATLAVGGQSFYVIWEAGTASALDAGAIAASDDVGSANAFYPELRDGTPISLALRDGAVRDAETGSTWNAAGRAVEGPRRGAQLRPAPGVQHFWFSHTAFAGE
jgi:hypothetical protein